MQFRRMVNRTLNLYFRNVYPAKWTRKTGFYFYSRQQQAVSGGQWRFSGLHQFDQWLMDWEETSVPGCSQLISIFSLLLSVYGTHEASSSFQGPSKFPNVCAASKPQDRPPPSLPSRCHYVPTSLCWGARGASRLVKRCKNVRQRELRRRPHVVRDTGPCCGRCSGEQNPNVTCVTSVKYEGYAFVSHAWFDMFSLSSF